MAKRREEERRKNEDLEESGKIERKRKEKRMCKFGGMGNGNVERRRKKEKQKNITEELRMARWRKEGRRKEWGIGRNLER